MAAKLLVLTYNIGNGRAGPATLTGMIQRCGADIVALQEVNHPQADALRAKLKKNYPYRAIYPGGFAGKAILSRYPILNEIQIDLGLERPDLQVTIEFERTILTVISAHPPPPRFHRTGFHFNSDTLRHIDALATMTIEHPPAILLGDFNLVDLQTEYQRIRSSGLRDAFQESGRGLGNTLPRRVGPWRRMQWFNRMLSWIPLIPVARVDYIWITDPIKSTYCWVGEDAGSDHLPVMAWLEIPK
jgi:vancomycin resistance protein VanJ